MVTDYRVVAGVGAPAVVVVHDREGAPPALQGALDALGGAGLTVVAIALGAAGSSEELTAVRRRVTDAVRDLRRGGVLAPRISGIGLGAGGPLVLQLATVGLFDSVVAYGTEPGPDMDLPCPVLAHAGDPHEPQAATESWTRTVGFLTGR